MCRRADRVDRPSALFSVLEACAIQERNVEIVDIVVNPDLGCVFAQNERRFYRYLSEILGDLACYVSDSV